MTVDYNWCSIKTDDNGMFALMCLHTVNSEEDYIISEERILALLKHEGIVYGINPIAVSALLEATPYEQFVCVAKGIQPQKGADGYYDYKKSIEDMKKKPQINEDGTADYKNSLNLAIIHEGELLASYVPPTKGTGGLTVFGKVLPPLQDGKKPLPLRGKGIFADKNNEHFYAQYTGHIVKEDTKIYIDKLYRVDGDLNIEVGNIKFDGDVEVMGDVRSGFFIEATGSIFVHGHVGACELKADNNIIIDKGIQGKGSCTITSGGDVVCKYIESCTINAGNNIYADSVLNSNLTAQNQVLITSKSGKVINGEVYGMCGVIIKEAGTDTGTPTLLRAGLPREYYARVNQLTNLISVNNEKIASFNHHLEVLEASTADDSSKASDTRMQIIRARIVLVSQNAEYTKELDSLKSKIEKDSENSFINITGTVFDGVRVYIGMYPYVVSEAMKAVTFRVGYKDIIMKPLEE